MKGQARKQCERCQKLLPPNSFDPNPDDDEGGTYTICRSCEFVEEYQFLRMSGLVNHEIAVKLGIGMAALMKRVNRLDCMVMNLPQRYAWDLIVGWVDRGQSFAVFDFPEWVPYEDVVWATARAARKGMIRRNGTAVSGRGRLFVPVDQKVLVS